GAFTGADKQKAGRFELADGGTLFLDEIGEIDADIQVKLLRVIQEREFVRLGGTETFTADVRIIAATNRDLKAEVEAGHFREDLYYRLNVFPIELPPLREREGDVVRLVEHFAGEIAPEMGVAAPTFAPDTLAILKRYHWPGNIRQLRNVVERCILLADETVEPAHLPPELAEDSGPASTPPAVEPGESSSTGSKLADQERAMIVRALQNNDWNKSAAARELGVSRDHLRYRVKKYDIEQPD
ncbi:MAG: sigma 54-interacting transcriptional regulator, partial [Phycisphaeraceae bacterium]|nr:sigma 54-interacting transcriptional regulator [Phycisphaeraceae bacterium]